MEMYKVAPSIEHEKVMTKKDAEGNETPVMGLILTPHNFRYNYASVLYNAGVDVLAAQKILGHADIKTTLSHSIQKAKALNVRRLGLILW